MKVQHGRCTIHCLALALAALLAAGSAHAQAAGEERPWGLSVRQFEWQDSATPEAYQWDVQGWAGSKRNRIWIRDEGGKHISGARYDNRLELLWGHRPRWWQWMDALELEMLLGLRHDSGTTPSRTYAALGFTGVLPLAIRFEGTGYLGDGSRLGDDVHSGVRVQLERGWDLGERWTLVLRGEHEVWSEDHVRYSEGIGPWMWSAGLRLHHRFGEHVAPYVGAEWLDLVGDTQSLAEAAGEESNEVRFVAGLRVQFGSR
jgi:copper resistance protein B